MDILIKLLIAVAVMLALVVAYVLDKNSKADRALKPLKDNKWINKQCDVYCGPKKIATCPDRLNAILCVTSHDVKLLWSAKGSQVYSESGTVLFSVTGNAKDICALHNKGIK